MAWREQLFGAGTTSTIEPEVEISASPTVSAGINLRNLHPGKIVLIGSYTGKEYTWEVPGAEVKVDEVDVPELLSKTSPGGCCGGGPSKWFEEIA